MTCDVCAYADRHGWWGPGHRGTHCRDCHKSWTGRAKAHCVVCHETFASNGVADKHWTKDGHVHPSETKRLTIGTEGVWHCMGARTHWTAASAGRHEISGPQTARMAETTRGAA